MQLSMSTVASSWVCRAPVKSGFAHRQSCPAPQGASPAGADCGAVRTCRAAPGRASDAVPAGAVAGMSAVAARVAARTVVRMVVQPPWSSESDDSRCPHSDLPGRGAGRGLAVDHPDRRQPRRNRPAGLSYARC
ncbi:hypothetical protein GCM10020227_10660 [Streptomyces flavovirens]